MDFTSVRYFLRICELNNFTKAAHELYISQPTLSRRILALEDELGVELLKRSSTGITVTEAGNLFYIEAKKQVDDQKTLVNKMRQFRESDYGIIRLGSNLSFFLEPILSAAQQMKNYYPNVEIDFQELSTSQMSEYFVCKKLDVAYGLRYMLPKSFNAITETIIKNSLTILVPKGHRLWNAENITFADLNGEKFVIETRGQDGTEDAFQFLEAHGISLKDSLVAKSPKDRLFAAAFHGCLAIGTELPDGSEVFSSYFRKIGLSEFNLNVVDVCISYHPSNSMTEKFVKYILGYTHIEHLSF